MKTKISAIYQILNIKNKKRYIGQSINVVSRLYVHKRHLICNTHPNKKLQQDWNKYGNQHFQFSILEEGLDATQLNSREAELIEQYNTIESGYNKEPGGITTCSNPKTRKIIGQKAKKRHEEWFSDYLATLRRPQGYVEVVSPDGVVYKFDNMGKFCREHKLGPHFRSLFKKRNPKRTYKGWHLNDSEWTSDKKSIRYSQSKRNKPYPKVVDPSGNIHTIDVSLRWFCRKMNLTYGCMNLLINGKKVSHLGWTIYKDLEK